MLSGREALERLREGNGRFVSGLRTMAALTSHTRRADLVEGQAPFAVILGCSDSRVPAEIVFDQGLGDLFVIRVAGNIVAPSQIASVEFAVEQFGTRLVVVLGHSRCGAVMATVNALRAPTRTQSGNLSSIVNRIRPAVEELIRGGFTGNDEALVDRAVRANVHASVNHLRHGSAVIEHLVETASLLVVGAEYSLATGEIEFLDGADEV